MSTTAIHKFDVIEAKTIGTTARAQMSIAVFRDRLIVQPSLMSFEEM